MRDAAQMIDVYPAVTLGKFPLGNPLMEEQQVCMTPKEA